MRDALLVAAATSPTAPGLAGRALLVVALLVATTLGWWLRSHRAGTFRAARTTSPEPSPSSRFTADDVQRDLGERATFVQFSSSTCATCPQVSRVLGGIARAQAGVVHVEVDAESSMDLVRRFGVLRTPTVLLVGPDGSVRSRTSGPVTSAQAQAALDALQPPSAAHTETIRSIHV